MNHEQVETFRSITGASQDVAMEKLQAHRGDLNAAINSFFNDGEPVLQNGEADRMQWMEVDEPTGRQPTIPFQSFPADIAPSGAEGFPSVISSDVSDIRDPRLPHRDTFPIVSHPRGEPRVIRPRACHVVDETLESADAHLPSHSPTDLLSDDDEVSGPASAVYRTRGNNGEYPFRTQSLDSPTINDVRPMADNEGADIEEEMIRAAIEASRRETNGKMVFREGQNHTNVDESGMHNEDDEMAWAMSQSLKTAEAEKAMRERLVVPGSPDKDPLHDQPRGQSQSGTSHDLLNRRALSAQPDDYFEESRSATDGLPPQDYSIMDVTIPHVNNLNDSDEVEEPLIRRRSSGRLNPTSSTRIVEPGLLGAAQGPSNQPGVIGYPSPPHEGNGDMTQSNEWGGLSTEEQEEAMMLEAAMFGRLPEDAARRFHYPSVAADLSSSDDGGQRDHARPIPRPPSPTVIAQRLLREQQDDEYLASLEADREKEVRARLEEEARRTKEEEAKAAAHAEEKLRKEEELRKCLAAEELERQRAAKQAGLPEEPSVDDEMAVTLMVRMPDGTRQGRRFRKSEHLQCLFDFIDVFGGVVPGSYRLVRHYPRKAFTEAEHGSTFHDLGLSSKNEVLFLELM